MATITFTTTFNLVPTRPLFSFTDTADYAGQGISTANVNGSFKIVSPSGVTVYNNTDYSDALCDIKVSTSTTNQTTIYLPLDSTNLVEVGTYTVTYTVKDITGAPVYYTKINSYDDEYVKPVIEISQDVNIIGQVWSQTDDTDYVVEGITPTMTRVNKLTYPAGVRGGAPAPVTTSAATLRTIVFFNGTQTSTVTTAATYVFADGLTIVDSLFGSKEFLVDGSYYCSVACGVKAYANTMNSLKNTNPIAYQTYLTNFNLVCSYIALIRLLIECNGGSDISQYIDKINDIIGDCNCGCDDDDDDFSRVTGWGSLVGADGTDGTDGQDGAAGADGTDGANGVAVLYNNFAGTSHTGAFTTLNSYTLAVDQLTTNGDVAQVHAVIVKAGVVSAAHIKMEIGGVDAMPQMSGAFGYLYFDAAPVYVSFDATITRLSATTVSVNYRFSVQYALPWGVFRVTEFTEPTITINNLTSATNLIDIQGSTDSTNTLTCSQMMVTYLKKS